MSRFLSRKAGSKPALPAQRVAPSKPYKHSFSISTPRVKELTPNGVPSRRGLRAWVSNPPLSRAILHAQRGSSLRRLPGTSATLGAGSPIDRTIDCADPRGRAGPCARRGLRQGGARADFPGEVAAAGP